MSGRTLRAVLIAAVLGLSSSCESAVAPPSSIQPMPLNQLFEGTATGDSVARYSFVGIPGEEYELLVRAVRGITWFDVLYENGDSVAPPFWANEFGYVPLEGIAIRFAPTERRAYVVEAWPWYPDSTVRFQLRLNSVTPQPETSSSATILGDTVAGESLDRVSDVDDFSFEGRAGQKMELVARVQPDVEGMLSAAIWGPSGTFVRTLSVTSYNPTTGPLTLPETGSYRIRFYSWGGPRYVGPYEFWTSEIE